MDDLHVTGSTPGLSSKFACGIGSCPFFDFCPLDRPPLRNAPFDSHLAIFVAHMNAFPSTFMDSLPPVPADAAPEEKHTWLQRTFR